VEEHKTKETKAQTSPKGRGKSKIPEIAVAILAAAVVAVILVGLLLLKLPVLPVILIVILEVGMAFCMQKVPLWIHGVVCAAQIVLGALTGNVIFLILSALLYFCGVLAVGLVLFPVKRRARA
jgi:hypothetical protein